MSQITLSPDRVRALLGTRQPVAPVSPAPAQPRLPRAARTSAAEKHKVSAVISAVEEEYGYTFAHIRGPHRHQPLVDARFALYKLLGEIPLSSSRVGFIVHRDHASVLSGVAALRELCEIDPAYKAKLDAARERARLTLEQSRGQAMREILARVTYGADGQILNIQPL